MTTQTDSALSHMGVAHDALVKEYGTQFAALIGLFVVFKWVIIPALQGDDDAAPALDGTVGRIADTVSSLIADALPPEADIGKVIAACALMSEALADDLRKTASH